MGHRFCLQETNVFICCYSTQIPQKETQGYCSLGVLDSNTGCFIFFNMSHVVENKQLQQTLSALLGQCSVGTGSNRLGEDYVGSLACLGLQRCGGNWLAQNFVFRALHETSRRADAHSWQQMPADILLLAQENTGSTLYPTQDLFLQNADRILPVHLTSCSTQRCKEMRGSPGNSPSPAPVVCWLPPLLLGREVRAGEYSPAPTSNQLSFTLGFKYPSEEHRLGKEPKIDLSHRFTIPWLCILRQVKELHCA